MPGELPNDVVGRAHGIDAGNAAPRLPDGLRARLVERSVLQAVAGVERVDRAHAFLALAATQHPAGERPGFRAEPLEVWRAYDRERHGADPLGQHAVALVGIEDRLL